MDDLLEPANLGGCGSSKLSLWVHYMIWDWINKALIAEHVTAVFYNEVYFSKIMV